MILRSSLLIILISQLCACGSGTSSSGGDIIDRSGRSIGKITAFGSVIVNGIAYDTQSAIITIDDQPGQESDLRVGQIVSINGLANSDNATGSAETITTEPSIEGLIDSIDLAQNTFTVLQSTVRITSATLFDSNISPSNITGLRQGAAVSIFGYLDSNGVISATLIQLNSTVEYELRGEVTMLDSGANRFSVNGQSISYATAVLEGFNTDITNGDYVEVEGTSINNAVLIADRVEKESNLVFSSADESTEVELEGLITRFVDSTDFDVNGAAVTTSSTTVYRDGSALDLGLDVIVEVEGTVDADGTIAAREIEFEREGNIVAEGWVEAVEADTLSLTLLGIEFVSAATTSLIDESDADLQFFSLQDIRTNDYVKIKAFAGASQNQATLIKRLNPEDKSKLKGPVTEISEPNLRVLTADITTGAGTNFTIGEVSATVTEFFSTVQIGDTVSVEGEAVIGGLNAEELELE